jgi:hypothetical protein
MKTNEYVKQFKLDKENYNFNREKFMEAFGQEFKDRIEAVITACKKMKVQFTYEKFLHAVKEQQDKFQSISNKKAGEPFSEKLFSAFFALHVIPLRASLFPNLHAELEEKRRKAQEMDEKIKAELEAKKKEQKEKQKRMQPILEAIIAYGAAQSLARKQKAMLNKVKGKK